MAMLKLFLRIVKLRFLAKIEYPGSYIAGIVSQWFCYGVEVIMAVIMVGTFGALAGWSPAEIVFLYGVWLITYALGASFSFNIANQLHEMAINGTMDEALVRPVPPLFYLIATNFNVGYLSHITLSLAVMVWSYLRMDVHWSAPQWAWLLVLVLSGAAIMGALMLMFMLPGLKLRARSPLSAVYFEARSFAKYPLAIYPRLLQLLLTSTVPFGFVGYYPLMALMGKTDPMTGSALIYISPLVAAACIAATGYCWRRTIKRYESAGT